MKVSSLSAKVDPTHRIISEWIGNHKDMSQEIKKPSWVPPAVALGAIVLSLAIYSVPILLNSQLIYCAYFLTPFIPILALAIARANDTKARSNVFYDLAKGKKIVTVTLVIAIIGFAVALPIMWQIATRLSLK